MNNPKLPVSEKEARELDQLLHGFKKLNGFHKVQLYRVTETEVIVGAKKFLPAEPASEELKKYRKEIIAALKDLFKPYIGDRKINIHVKFYFDDAIGAVDWS
ncbi:MAG: hypothetical protein J0L54_04530 [Chitinophagales bacterium]|nr:hypothetical protein [Chitinophagales bacterium]